jgi:hypothetical protein
MREFEQQVMARKRHQERLARLAALTLQMPTRPTIDQLRLLKPKPAPVRRRAVDPRQKALPF